MTTETEFKALREAIGCVLARVSGEPKIAYTLDEAVNVTGIGRTSLYADHAEGKLEMRKRGTRTIILADELRRYLAALPAAETKQ